MNKKDLIKGLAGTLLSLDAKTRSGIFLGLNNDKVEETVPDSNVGTDLSILDKIVISDIAVKNGIPIEYFLFDLQRSPYYDIKDERALRFPSELGQPDLNNSTADDYPEIDKGEDLSTFKERLLRDFGV